MTHVLAVTGAAVIVRHWFEIDLEDASLEHGCRVELREVGSVEHRGSESAAQMITVDRPLWRADLFDRIGDEPGTFGAAHVHPSFEGDERCDRVWDDRLTAEPWGWLRERVVGFGSRSAAQPAALAPEDAADVRGLADEVVAIGRRFAPAACRSTADCHRLTRDVRHSVQLMVKHLSAPSRLDKEAVLPWTAQ